MPAGSNQLLHVRIAAVVCLIASLAHIGVFFAVAESAAINPPAILPAGFVVSVFYGISSIGLLGIAVGIGLLRLRNWARIAILGLGAIGAMLCAFNLAIAALILFGIPLGMAQETSLDRSSVVMLMLLYLILFAVCVWWLLLFSRKPVTQLFSATVKLANAAQANPCPPPITMLAWLMILCGALSALATPLVSTQMPLMIFHKVVRGHTCTAIWAINAFIFLVCGIGLLRVKRWGYSLAIAFHIFWTLSFFVSSLSPSYSAYILEVVAPFHDVFNMDLSGFAKQPSLFAAILGSLPGILLVVGLFYYRRNFLNAATISGSST